MKAKKLQRDFIRQIGNFDQFRRLMEHLPDVYFFVKNRKSQLMMGNKLFLVKCGLKNELELVGKTDYELFPEDRVKNYLKDDRYVMKTDHEVVNRVELAPDRDGSLNWFITTKIPLYSKKRKIIGLAAVARDGQKTKAVFLPYFEITKAVQYIREHYEQPLEIKRLASIVNLSVRQFERRFYLAFKTSPAAYIARVRVEAACERLQNSSDKIAVIAQEVGFYDQSHMVKTFIKIMGVSPTTYRNKYL
jgi:PAS domain S-box-containing protein